MSSLANVHIRVAADSAQCLLPRSMQFRDLDFEIEPHAVPGYITGSSRYPQKWRYPLKWRLGGWSGDGVVDIIPASAWASELQVELRSPNGRWSRLSFGPQSRLDQPAWDLTDALRRTIESTAAWRTRAQESRERRGRRAARVCEAREASANL